MQARFYKTAGNRFTLVVKHERRLGLKNVVLSDVGKDEIREVVGREAVKAEERRSLASDIQAGMPLG